VPFIIVGALLAGAAIIRKQFGNAPAAPVAPLLQADPNAWQKMTDLARADQLVREKLDAARRAGAALAAAERNRANLHVTFQRSAADQAVANAQKALDSARQCFESALRNYQQLGGTTDYRRQLPR
jgi:hypothetical protein